LNQDRRWLRQGWGYWQIWPL